MSFKSGTVANYLELIDELDGFLTTTGHAWGKSYSGTGTGNLTAYLGTASSVAETFTITATSATTFTVVGSTSGALANATVGTPYTSAKVAFTITAGGTPFVAGDRFYLSTSPKWTRLRAEGSPDQASRASDFVDVENLFDGTGTIVQRTATTGYVEWTMRRATEIRQMDLQCYEGTRAPKDFALQWRDSTGASWTTAQAWTSQTWLSNETKVFNVGTPGAHLYWRLNITDTTDTNATVAARLLQVQNVWLRPKLLDSYSVTERFELAWRAPGLDGTKQIHIGLKTYGSAAADVWNCAFTGFRAWDSSKAVDAQPNGDTGRWLSLINSPMSYWIVANGQRFIVVVKFASIYQTAYCGFGLPYEPPSVHAYPEIIAATHTERTLRYDSNSANFRHPADPGTNGLAAFYPDAQWRLHTNRAPSGSNDPEGQANGNLCVWPNRLLGETDGRPTDMRDNLDGSRPLLPCVIYASVPNGLRHVWGEFDGYYWTPGFGTVAEALIADQGFNHLVVNNVFRTGTQNYAAVRLD